MTFYFRKYDPSIFYLTSFVKFIREGKDKNTQYLNLMYCELSPNKTCRLLLPEIVVTRNKDLSAREKEVIYNVQLFEKHIRQ